jgi:hypothetical protein
MVLSYAMRAGQVLPATLKHVTVTALIMEYVRMENASVLKVSLEKNVNLLNVPTYAITTEYVIKMAPVPVCQDTKAQVAMN